MLSDSVDRIVNASINVGTIVMSCEAALTATFCSTLALLQEYAPLAEDVPLMCTFKKWKDKVTTEPPLSHTTDWYERHLTAKECVAGA